MGDKIPVSVLVVIHAGDGQVLLLERADHPGWWQSVTGSQDPGETLEETALREVREETGLDARQYRLEDWGYSNVYEIYELLEFDKVLEAYTSLADARRQFVLTDDAQAKKKAGG